MLQGPTIEAWVIKSIFVLISCFPVLVAIIACLSLPYLTTE